VSNRRPFSRVLLGGLVIGGGFLAVLGGLSLHGNGLIGVCLAATLAACTAAGITREAPASTRGSILESAVWAAGWTTGGLLVVAGVSTVAGGAVAAIVVAAGLAAFLVVRLRRSPHRRTRATTQDRAAGGDVLRLPVAPQAARPGSSAGPGPLLPPVTALTTRALGDEWLRTTAALSGRLTPGARGWLVARREEMLDELERRDAGGFNRWLAAGPTRDSDPADFVRGGPAHRGPVADTDAA
jgi:hypothetical protein